MAIRTLEALDPAFRHAQTPAVLHPSHQFYEWFYFEVDFEGDDGRPYRVITSLHFPHGIDPRRVLAHQRYQAGGVDFFSRYGDDPQSYAGIATYVVDVNRSKNLALVISRFQPDTVPARVALSRPGDPVVDLKLGRCSFKEIAPDTYKLVVKQTGIFYRPGQANRLLTVDMEVDFEQNTPGFQPPSGELIEQTGVKHFWACVMPNPKLTVRRIAVERGKAGGGSVTLCKASNGARAHSGYHDHQWGDDLIYKQIVDWSWGRLVTGARGASLPPDKVLFFDVNGVSSPTIPGARPDPILVGIPGDGSHVEELGVASGHQPFRLAKKKTVDFGDGCRLGITGQRVPYYEALRLRTVEIGGESRNFDVDHLLADNVDVWPFYLRFMPRVVDFHSGRTFVGISEYMRADRLATAGAQKILALSDKMTYLE
jgi:hypothetical protein